MKVLYKELNVGAEIPFRIVHISDTHLTLADDRDCERKLRLAQKRAKHFSEAEDVLKLASDTAREWNAPIMHTGDLLDFVSVANIERAKQFTDENDCFLAAGNHEFSQYVGEAWEDAAYRNQSLPAVQTAFKNNIRMSSRVIHGVNFVALDNGYYLFDEEQLAFLKNEAEKGLPIVLMMHTPIYEPKLFDDVMYHRENLGLKPTPQPCAYLTAVPEEWMGGYDDHRFRQQKADDITRCTVDYIRSEPLIKAILTGHLHFSCDAILREGVPQLIVSTTDVNLITIR